MSRQPFILLASAILFSLGIPLDLGGSLTQILVGMPGSRKQEAKADYIGLLMMARGCYRPEAAMEFWMRMEKLGQQGPPQILSTHPSNHNREEKIREWLPKAHEMAAESECQGLSGYGESSKSSVCSIIQS